MDDLTRDWGRLSLSNQEGSDFCVRQDLGSDEFILAAEFFTKRILSTEAIARTFKQLWHSRNGFKTNDLVNHIVLFIFENKLETDQVLSSEPGSFDKRPMVIQSYDKDMKYSGFGT